MRPKCHTGDFGSFDEQQLERVVAVGCVCLVRQSLDHVSRVRAVAYAGRRGGQSLLALPGLLPFAHFPGSLLLARVADDRPAHLRVGRSKHVRLPKRAGLFPFLQRPGRIPRRPAVSIEIVILRVGLDPLGDGGCRTRGGKHVSGAEILADALVVDDLLSPAIQLGQQLGFDRGILRVVGDVVRFVRVLAQIIQLDLRLARPGGPSWVCECLWFRNRKAAAPSVMAQN